MLMNSNKPSAHIKIKTELKYLIGDRCFQIHFMLFGPALLVKQALAAKARRQRHRIHEHTCLLKIIIYERSLNKVVA